MTPMGEKAIQVILIVVAVVVGFDPRLAAESAVVGGDRRWGSVWRVILGSWAVGTRGQCGAGCQLYDASGIRSGPSLLAITSEFSEPGSWAIEVSKGQIDPPVPVSPRCVVNLVYRPGTGYPRQAATEPP
jgi:hypothetical protein